MQRFIDLTVKHNRADICQERSYINTANNQQALQYFRAFISPYDEKQYLSLVRLEVHTRFHPQQPTGGDIALVKLARRLTFSDHVSSVCLDTR